jgi:hypothetical protein
MGRRRDSLDGPSDEASGFVLGRAALLAALALLGFACVLMLFALLVRCAAGGEVPVVTPGATDAPSALWLGALLVTRL